MAQTITDLSKEYLKKFLVFAKPALGYGPIILGGWAVFALTNVEQSVDVDVLLKNKNDIAKITLFFESNGFKPLKDRTGEISFEKILTQPSQIGGIRIESMIFDILTKNEPNELHENKKTKIPWKLCFEYQANVKIDDLEMIIPSPELLLVYKVKALRDRTNDKYKFFHFMQHKKIWLARKDFKIEKDKRDIKNLISSGKTDFEKLNRILSKTKFQKLYEETIERL